MKTELLNCVIGVWEGKTPLLLAVSRGHDMVAQVLIEHGANPDIPNKAEDRCVLPSLPMLDAVLGGAECTFDP
eukprot:jgi/Chrzof1/13380/Cz07g30250.t1